MNVKNKYPGFIARASQSQNRQTQVQVINEHGATDSVDRVTIEEPLEILLATPDTDELTLAITMRTPGHDDELALGFLFTEGIIACCSDINDIEHCRPPSAEYGHHNTIRITLAANTNYDPALLKRHFYMSSSCGVCGKTSLDAVLGKVPAKLTESLRIAAVKLKALPVTLETQQREFQRTGGIHAAALFDQSGCILSVREDVGRHNALDKLIGESLLSDDMPISRKGLLLSGRASFELVQKAAMSGIELIAAIGPPSSLAIDLAQSCGITLVGFLKDSRFNVYTSAFRIV